MRDPSSSLGLEMMSSSVPTKEVSTSGGRGKLGIRRGVSEPGLFVRLRIRRCIRSWRALSSSEGLENSPMLWGQTTININEYKNKKVIEPLTSSSEPPPFDPKSSDPVHSPIASPSSSTSKSTSTSPIGLLEGTIS